MAFYSRRNIGVAAEVRVLLPREAADRSDLAAMDPGETSGGAFGEPIRDFPSEELIAFRLATQVVLSLGRLPRQRPMGDAPGLVQVPDDRGIIAGGVDADAVRDTREVLE